MAVTEDAKPVLIITGGSRVTCSPKMPAVQDGVFSAEEGTMRGKRFGEKKVIEILRFHAAGTKTADVCRQHGISASTLYAW